MVNAQQWLENNYPNKETESIYINQQIERFLDCRRYKKLKYIFISTSVDRSKLEIKGGSYEYYELGVKGVKETKIIPCILAQEYINQKYPTQQENEEEK